MDKQDSEKTLTLLNDSVLDLKNSDTKDAFNHKVYADILAKIFAPMSGNKYGITVALFGKWGQGKSSIIEMLKCQLTNLNTETIIFNAWTSRGDSIRRQLVLRILETVKPKKARDFKRHIGINLPDAFDEKNWGETSQTYLKAALSIVTSPIVGVSLVCASLLTLIVLCTFALAFKSDKHCDVYLSIASLFTSASVFLFLKTCDAIRSKYEQSTGRSIVAEHQLLKYPEQFAEIASRYIALYCKRTKRDVLIVVDDLDRCDPVAVVEALASIKQLSAIQQYEKAKYPVRLRFLIPCDEHQVVLALEADSRDAGSNNGHYHDYKSDELLRKFFDVVVRMDAFIPEDMVKYAGDILLSTGRFAESDIYQVQKLIGAVAPRDPRQVKQLVNAYLVFTEKLRILKAAKLSRRDNTLLYLDNTLLFAIALQETLPTVFRELVVSPESLNQIRHGISIDSLPNKDQKRATSILHALDPISETTLRLLTRKGLPEELVSVNNGPDIFDAVYSGDVEVFTSAISKTDDLHKVCTWLKTYRKAIHGTAQFRYALTCLINVKQVTEEFSLTIEDYLQFPELKDALKGYAGLERLACIGAKGLLKDSIVILQRTLFDIFHNELIPKDRLASTELKALLIMSATDKPHIDEALVSTICSQLSQSGQEYASKYLTQLQTLLPANFKVVATPLAISIASDCPWSIYNTSEPDKNKGRHSDLIAAFIGDDAATTAKIVELLFKPKGPLDSVISLTNTGSQKGEREALRTLANIAKNLLPSDTAKLYEKLIPWINAQSDMGDFKFVCDILRSIWHRLSEAQIDAFAKLLTERCNTAIDAEWLSSFVESAECHTDTKTQTTRRFCKSVLSRLNGLKLTHNTFDNSTKELLKGMADHKWPIADDADSIFADAIKSRISDKGLWNNWAELFWPLVEHCHALTEQALCERIKQKVLPDVFIPFSVGIICNQIISLNLSTALKEYFCSDTNAFKIKFFDDMFNNTAIKGTDTILKLIVDDFAVNKFSPTEPQVEFLLKHHEVMSTETKSMVKQLIRIRYLQASDQTKLATGIRYLHKMGSPDSDSINWLSQVAREQSKTMSTETQSLIEDMLGKKLFEEKKS
jgi:hypothetical protein